MVPLTPQEIQPQARRFVHLSKSCSPYAQRRRSPAVPLPLRAKLDGQRKQSRNTIRSRQGDVQPKAVQSSLACLLACPLATSARGKAAQRGGST